MVAKGNVSLDPGQMMATLNLPGSTLNSLTALKSHDASLKHRGHSSSFAGPNSDIVCVNGNLMSGSLGKMENKPKEVALTTAPNSSHAKNKHTRS